MDWLFEHNDDPDIDEPFEVPKGHTLSETAPDGNTSHQAPAGEGEQDVAKSLKCDDCNKLLRTPEEAEMHAARTGHSNFSETTEEIKPLTEEEKQAQLAKIQEKIKLKRLENEEKEKQESVRLEKLRRSQGKELAAMRQKMQEDEIRKIAEQRRKEKEEDKLAKQRVRELIEKDKKDRAVKFGMTSPAEDSCRSADNAPVAASPSVQSTPAAPKEYKETRLQIRMTNGASIVQTFGVNEPLAAVRLYIQLNRTDCQFPFTFSTTFPRKVYNDDDMEAPLQELGLVPSAVLMVTKL